MRKDSHMCVYVLMDRVVKCAVSLVAYGRSWRRCCRSVIVLYHSLAPPAPVTAWTTPNTRSLRLLHAQPLRHSPVSSRPHSVANNTDIDQNLSVGDRILKTIGWMAGFYSRKAVSSKALYYGTCIANILNLEERQVAHALILGARARG